MIPCFLGAITGSSLLTALIWVVAAALIYFICDWGLKQIGIPEPFSKLARVILVVVVVVILVNAILIVAGHPFISISN